MSQKGNAYVITDKSLNLYIRIVDINSLHAHEEVVAELLDQLVRSLELKGCVMDPVIVDENSLVVLDGVHRVAALKTLRVKRIPACLVDYRNPNIKVFDWYRTLTGTSDLDSVIALTVNSEISMEQTRQINLDHIGDSPIVAAIRFRDKSFLVKSSFQNLREAYDIIQRIEDRFKAVGFRLKYETEADALKSLRSGRCNAVICTPKLSKQKIIEAAVTGHIFGPKTSRHIIPARPMRLNVPLNLLQDDRKSLSEINEELRKTLQKRHVRRIAPGGLLDGRRYEEKLFVFEE